MPANKQISFETIHRFLRTMFAGDLHAKRILSLAGATLGAIESASLAVALIGQGLALARGLVTKHAIKQVDRMLANQGIDVDALLHHWVPFVVGKRPSMTVAMDWTEFEADGQATIMLSLLCRHGRATPLIWHLMRSNLLILDDWGHGPLRPEDGFAAVRGGTGPEIGAAKRPGGVFRDCRETLKCTLEHHY